jgi:hypothetical protein
MISRHFFGVSSTFPARNKQAQAVTYNNQNVFNWYIKLNQYTVLCCIAPYFYYLEQAVNYFSKLDCITRFVQGCSNKSDTVMTQQECYKVDDTRLWYSWLDFGRVGRCAPPLRLFCTSLKSSAPPLLKVSINDRSKWKFDIFCCLRSTNVKIKTVMIAIHFCVK